MKLRFHARITLLALSLGAALLHAALLTSCGSACAAACYSSMTLTLTNADDTAHSYVVTLQATALGTLTETCGPSGDAGAPLCTGSAAFITANAGQIQLELMSNPVPFDVTVTRDGALVASAHLTPIDSTVSVCGEVCARGDATLALP